MGRNKKECVGLNLTQQKFTKNTPNVMHSIQHKGREEGD